MDTLAQKKNATLPLITLWWRCFAIFILTLYLVACGGSKDRQIAVIQGAGSEGVIGITIPRGLSDTIAATKGTLSIDIYVDDIKNNAVNENLTIIDNRISEKLVFETGIGEHQVYLKYYLTVSGQRIHIATSSTFDISVTADGISPSLDNVTILDLPDDDGNGESNLSELTARFQLTITKSGDGTGTVTATNINCGDDCDEITVSATPLQGSAFVSWAGDCSGNTPSTNIAMTAVRGCNAEFIVDNTPTPPPQAPVQLTITKTGSGAGTVTATDIDCGTDCEETYESDTSVTLFATPDLGSSFVAWTGDCSGTIARLTISMTAIRTCYAEFDASPSVIVTVPSNNATEVPINTLLTINFSEAMDETSIQVSDFRINDGVSSPQSPSSVTVSGNTVTLVQSALMQRDANYIITVFTTLTDQQQEPPTVEYSWSFRTSASETFPEIIQDTLQDGSLGPRMVIIPGGSFTMGLQDTELSRPGYLYLESRPRHLVTIAKPFAVSESEVTFEEYDKYVQTKGESVRSPEDSGWMRGTRPVIDVSWNDAHGYINWLIQQTGNNYRLPTEAEWEYAARAGSTSWWWWGYVISHDNANYSCDNDINRFCSTNNPPGLAISGTKDIWVNTSPVRSFTANQFGLYDTTGNVTEWVKDCWHSTYDSAPSDGSAWIDANGGDCAQRMIRGGSWTDSSATLHSAVRSSSLATGRSNITGFRLARDVN